MNWYQSKLAELEKNLKMHKEYNSLYPENKEFHGDRIIKLQERINLLKEVIAQREKEFEELKSYLSYTECGKCGHESYAKFVIEEDIDRVKNGDVK
jgi:bacterioferritin-associated ferredoxin